MLLGNLDIQLCNWSSIVVQYMLVMKRQFLNIHHKLIDGNYKSKMILQVHDELLFDVHYTEEKEMKDLITQEMQNAVDIGVPLDVEALIAENWLEAH